MKEGLFSNNTFDLFSDVSTQLTKTEDYFDFPSSLIAFAESLSSSSLFIVDGVFFRKRNKILTLITFMCSSVELKKILNDLIKLKYTIKILNTANKDISAFNTKNYMKEYFVLSDYHIEKHCSILKAKHRGNILRDIRKGFDSYYITDDIHPKETTKVFNLWYEGAQTRHFMVVKGHYLKYIERFFQQQNNVKFIAFRKKSDDALYGFAGYELFNGFAQITVMKHCFGDNSFPTFFWSKTIENILTHDVAKIFCGTTADELKQRLGFNSQKSVKILL